MSLTQSDARKPIVIFGEVLFDCFPGGEEVLGGAPFNIAWNLQAFGDDPVFVSRVGKDPLGQQIIDKMQAWGLGTEHLQEDMHHPTGVVEVNLIDKEPEYSIIEDRAYDFIDETQFNDSLPKQGLLYHGCLGLRNKVSRCAYMRLKLQGDWSVFLDVNLRKPWWQKNQVYHWMEKASWVKLNHEEVRMLGFEQALIEDAMSAIQSQFDVKQVIVTCGAEGAKVLDENGQIFQQRPQAPNQFVDTVGAGDAFTSVFIHGLNAGWDTPTILEKAQNFASRIIGIRGATTTNPDFYRQDDIH